MLPPLRYGQVGIFEFLKVDTHMRRLIAKNSYGDELWNAAREAGMRSLFEDAWTKVIAGITTIDEVLVKVPEQYIEKEEKTTQLKERLGEVASGKNSSRPAAAKQGI